VSQPTYGAGTLVEVNELTRFIDFDDGLSQDVRDAAGGAAGSRTNPRHTRAYAKRAVKKKESGR